MVYLPDSLDLIERKNERRIYFSLTYPYQAYFHGWTRDNENKLQAVLELQDGSIKIESMIYGLVFIDK